MTSISEFDSALAAMEISADGKFIYHRSHQQLPEDVQPFVQIYEDDLVVSIIPYEQAKSAKLLNEKNKNVYSRLAIKIPATLESTGLTSAICVQLSAQSIPSNVITSITRDYLMVPASRTDETLEVLDQLSTQARAWSQS